MEKKSAVAPQPTGEFQRKVVFADFATVKFGGVIEALTKIGVLCETVTDVPKLMQRMTEERFDICIVNLLLAGIGPFELIENVRKNSANKEVKIIVVTRQVHKLNIQNTIRAGANDFIAEPFEYLTLYHRIAYHLGPVREIALSGLEQQALGPESQEYIKLLMDSTEILSKTPRDKAHDSFLTILQNVAKLMGSNRTNLIIVDEPSNTGVVLATSDDPNFHNFPLVLDQYPEVLHVIHTGNLIFVEDVAQNSLTERIKRSVRSISIGSLMCFPVCYQGEVVGVLNVRRPEATELPPVQIMRVMQALANIMAAHANVAVLLRRVYKGYSNKPAA